ncbi:hypothetical protein HAX54_008945 [Datura stramonium]|uniref:Uncharacterized protein n=1 Tax=Datura stramonium TaxID=4076 RepID=A0ABS8RVQ9_DATST|nr:hypothetical protein [Datura stramonium]
MQTLVSKLCFTALDDESYMFERRSRLLHRLQKPFMDGYLRASVNYLADASWLARKIITIWNMKNPMAIWRNSLDKESSYSAEAVRYRLAQNSEGSSESTEISWR